MRIGAQQIGRVVFSIVVLREKGMTVNTPDIVIKLLESNGWGGGGVGSPLGRCGAGPRDGWQVEAVSKKSC